MKCLEGLFARLRNRVKQLTPRLRSACSNTSTAADKPLLHHYPKLGITLEKLQSNETDEDAPRSSKNRSSTETKSTGSAKTADTTSSTEKDDPEWGPIKSIPDRAFVKLALRHIDPEGHLGGAGAFVSQHCHGSFHRVVMVKFLGGGTWVLRVPAAGWEGRWTHGDACNLRSEACTMKFIRAHTNVPVPMVLAYDSTLNNELHAPYIMMEYMDGKPAYETWYDRDEDGDLTNLPVGPERAAKRVRFLDSLAQAISELRNFEFDKIGMLDVLDEDGLGHPTVVPKWDSREIQNRDITGRPIPGSFRRQVYSIPTYGSSKEYWTTQLRKAWPIGRAGFGARCDGISKISEYILNTLPFSASKEDEEDETETFVLAHADLDLQNILTDDEGNVTGIIDWDGVSVVPRCIGYSATPVWLREDWKYDYSFPDDLPSPADLAYYRDAYRQAMVSAMAGEGDCKYTAKSDIYTAIDSALYGSSDSVKLPDVVDKILGELLGPRFIGHSGFEERIAEGDYEDGEEALENLLPGYLKPTI